MTTKAQKDGLTLKYISPYLGALIVICCLVLGVDIERLADEGVAFVASPSFVSMTGLAAAAIVFCVAVQNFLPRAWRETIVFWRVNHRLPGYRAFSKFALGDGRINATRLARAGGRPDLSPEKQNDLWYQWYRKTQDEPSVWHVSRLYLAFRDLAAVVLISSPVAFAAWILEGQSAAAAVILSGFVLGSYFLSIVVARNKAVELVTNVLALKSSAGDPEPRILQI